MTRPRLLPFKSLYPSAARPQNGISVDATVADRDPQAFATALRAVINSADPAACRAHATRFGWEPVASELAQLIERVIAGSAPTHARAA